MKKLPTQYPLFNQWLINVDYNDYWKFIMDGDDHSKGEDFYDKEEPGYKIAMLTALQEIFSMFLSSEDINLSSELLRQLHANCIANVKSLVSNSNDFRNQTVAFGLDIARAPNCSHAGILEMMSKWRTVQFGEMMLLDEQNNTITSYQNAISILESKKDIYCKIKPPESGRIEEGINHVFNMYRNEISTLATQREKLLLICETIHQLEIMHPFIDGNTRTISMMLLSLLLIQNNFYPIILDDPNVFVGHTAAELSEMVIEALNKTKILYELDDTLELDMEELSASLGKSILRPK